MSAKKKLIRGWFRNKVFTRDKNHCVMCGVMDYGGDYSNHDAHHITDRNLMPNGGYVPENGIELCPVCHNRAEQWHNTGEAYPGYHPNDLYKKIGSSYEEAVKASERLGK